MRELRIVGILALRRLIGNASSIYGIRHLKSQSCQLQSPFCSSAVHQNSNTISQIGIQDSRSDHNNKESIPAKRKSRKEFLFGIGPCLLALRDGRRKIFKIFIKEGALNTSRPEFTQIRDMAKEKIIPIIEATKNKLMKLSEGRPAQNVVMEVSLLKFSKFSEDIRTHTSELDKQRQDRLPLWLALDEIQDPMNFGAILRTCRLLGVHRVVVPQRNSAPLSPVVSKASAGAMEVMDVYQTQELHTFLKERVDAGWEVLGAVQPDLADLADYQTSKPLCCTGYKMSKPTVLVLGNEGAGLRSKVLRQCTRLISIYPHGDGREVIGLDSLNVSVATGILVFSIMKNSDI